MQFHRSGRTAMRITEAIVVVVVDADNGGESRKERGAPTRVPREQPSQPRRADTRLLSTSTSAFIHDHQ
jgi:hypothetical protein